MAVDFIDPHGQRGVMGAERSRTTPKRIIESAMAIVILARLRGSKPNSWTVLLASIRKGWPTSLTTSRRSRSKSVAMRRRGFGILPVGILNPGSRYMVRQDQRDVAQGHSFECAEVPPTRGGGDVHCRDVGSRDVTRGARSCAIS